MAVPGLAVETDIVAKSGAWFNYGDVRLGQGRENVKKFLAENPDLFREIRDGIFKAKGINLSPTETKPETVNN